MMLCPRCGEVKSLDEFGSNRSKANGKNSYCKVCVREISASRKEYKRAWDAAHKNELNERSRQWAMDHKEKRSEISRKSYLKNRDKALEWKRKYYQENKEKYAEWERRAHEKNPHIHLAAKSRYMARQHGCEVIPYDRKAVYERDGGRCRYCGKATKAVDHVLPLSRGGPDSFENVVLCCHSCNVSKNNRTVEEWLSNDPRKVDQHNSKGAVRKRVRGNRDQV